MLPVLFLFFYLQAPLYAASNRAGASLFLGAIAINVIAPPALLAAALIVAALDFRSILEMERRWAGQRDVPIAVAGIEAYLDQERSRMPLIDVDGAWAQGVPIILRLRQHHRRVAVSTGSLFIVTDVFAPTGREDAWIRVQPGPRGAPETGWRQVFDSYWANVYAR